MDFMQALNVTIYGLGVVFLALLVLMFSIMVLSKLFSVATGREILVAPGVALEDVPRAEAATAAAPQVAAAPASPAAVAGPTPPPAPAAETLQQVFAPLPGKILSVAVQAGDVVRKGDELCVIEAMKMGNSIKSEWDGIIREIQVTPGQTVGFGASLFVIATSAPAGAVAPTAPAAAAPAVAGPPPVAAAPAAGPFKMGVRGEQYQVELKGDAASPSAVVIDGTSFRVERDRANNSRIVVDGKAHTVEVKEVAGGVASVVIDGVPLKVEITRQAPPVPIDATFKMGVAGREHKVELKGVAGGPSTVVVDGASFKVERDKADERRLLVDGKPHAVLVNEVVGNVASVVIDGVPTKVEIVRETVGAHAAPASAPAQVRATAAAPAAAPAAPQAPPGAQAGGEPVTAPLPGKILSVAVKAGDVVRKGDELCVIEAMKMGNSIKAQRDGTVVEVLVSPGDNVGFGAPLCVLG